MLSKTNHIHSKPTRQVGFVVKAHGFKGHLRLNLDQSYIPKDFLFIEINNKFVPFEIQSFNENASLIKLKDFETIDSVQSLINFPIVELLDKPLTAEISIIGYILIDVKSKHSFDIVNVIEYPGNTLIEFRDAFKDFLLPWHTDFIKSIDHNNQTISAEFPDGLMDL